MRGLFEVLVDWLKTHESLAIWLEGVALVAIFVLDWKERQDQRKERQEQHKETAQQLDVAQRQVEAASRSAGAARLSAEASQKSAEVLSELNRPYMGVAAVELRPDRNSQNSPVWSIAWTIKNFGSLPARDVQAAVELHLEGKGLLLDDRDNGPHGAELFPQSEGLTTTTILKWDDQQDRLSVMNGQNAFVVRVSISYASSGSLRYKHSADVKFNQGYGTFSVNASQTQPF